MSFSFPATAAHKKMSILRDFEIFKVCGPRGKLKGQPEGVKLVLGVPRGDTQVVRSKVSKNVVVSNEGGKTDLPAT